ncbi:TetR/AcrR family transcriptional regulator [Nocardia pseudobrasiliensis]|uniref:TetR family transcriptional regulator n=1 Tax=Nocardia pseudobrasiliensis TaxID=45979 RepID=A0A370IBG3_9NOCA|nr:TetR/AcrR family transcriptional regulator [Nocardia pseudobrasiliensis]RDI67950.1 TetR family transcriptional regulator [Nocardia pseudobrasiliensis]
MASKVTGAHRLMPEPTGDARADRWREHRAAVRAEVVESTLRAIDELGPDLSIDDIVKAAGVTRPKLYRFFADKDQLFEAVRQRVQDLLIERMVPLFPMSGTVEESIRAALTAYVTLVAEHPNLFRFLVGSQFGEGHSAMTLLEGGRGLSDSGAALLSMLLRSRGGDGDNIEYVVDGTLGAVGLAVLRWLNSPTIDQEALVTELTTFVWGAFSAVAAARGVALRLDERVGPQDFGP